MIFSSHEEVGGGSERESRECLGGATRDSDSDGAAGLFNLGRQQIPLDNASRRFCYPSQQCLEDSTRNQLLLIRLRY